MKDDIYFSYLNKISWRSYLYRFYFVYPIIKRFCKKKVLDVGCGTGLFLKYYPNAVGVDVNKFCVAHCKSLGLNAKNMNYDELPFDNSSYQSIILDNVIEHIENPKPLLKECHRVLEFGGTIIVLVPGKKGYLKDYDHKVYYNRLSLKDVLKKNNFSILKEKSLPFLGLENYLNAFCFMTVGIKHA